SKIQGSLRLVFRFSCSGLFTTREGTGRFNQPVASEPTTVGSIGFIGLRQAAITWQEEHRREFRRLLLAPRPAARTSPVTTTRLPTSLECRTCRARLRLMYCPAESSLRTLLFPGSSSTRSGDVLWIRHLRALRLPRALRWPFSRSPVGIQCTAEILFMIRPRELLSSAMFCRAPTSCTPIQSQASHVHPLKSSRPTLMELSWPLTWGLRSLAAFPSRAEGFLHPESAFNSARSSEVHRRSSAI